MLGLRGRVWQGSQVSDTVLQAKIQQEAWSSALKKAKGEKVYDDPKLLRK